MLLVHNMRTFTHPVCRVLASRVHTAPSLLEKHDSLSQLIQEEPNSTESSNNKRQSLFMRRKLHDGLNKTLNIFRDLGPRYSFLKISPPVPNIDVQQISSSFWLKFASHTQDRLDLLEAWHLMASQPRLVEEKEEKEICLVRSHQEEQIILKIIQHFPDYSYQQLSQLTFNLEILRSRPELKKQFTRSLHYHLTGKMKEIIMTKDFRPEELDQCLSVSFILLRADIEYNIDPATGRREHRLRGGHNSALLELLLSHHLTSLTPPQLVYTLFLAGVQKEYPGCGYRAEGQGFPLPDSCWYWLNVSPLVFANWP